MKSKSQSRSAEKGKGTPSMKPSGPYKTANRSSKWYQDCRVTLDRFQDCLFDHDLERLIIRGKPTKKQLSDAWNKIYIEYVEMMNDGSYNEVFDHVLDINEISAKVFFVDRAVQYLIGQYDEKVNKMLNDYGLNTGVLPEDDILVRINKLNLAKSRAKSWIVRQQKLQQELDEIMTTKTVKDGGKYYFEDALDAISRYRKYAVRPEQMTVIQFCRTLKQMEQEYIKHQSQQHAH